MKELFKKIIIVFIFQLIGWYAYTYMEEGFSLTDCIFDRDNIRRLKTPEEKNTKAELYKNLNESLMGELNETLFRIYHAEFKTFFKAKEPEAKPVDVNAICMKWYLFTAITLTTVGKATYYTTATMTLLRKQLEHIFTLFELIPYLPC